MTSTKTDQVPTAAPARVGSGYRHVTLREAREWARSAGCGERRPRLKDMGAWDDRKVELLVSYDGCSEALRERLPLLPKHLSSHDVSWGTDILGRAGVWVPCRWDQGDGDADIGCAGLDELSNYGIEGAAIGLRLRVAAEDRAHLEEYPILDQVIACVYDSQAVVKFVEALGRPATDLAAFTLLGDRIEAPPSAKIEAPNAPEAPAPGRELAGLAVTVIGSFHRDLEGLQKIIDRLRGAGATVLEPQSLEFMDPGAEFVRLPEEAHQSVAHIECRVLGAIKASDLVWLHCPEGYVGASAAFEIGAAWGNNVPVYCEQLPNDPTLTEFVTQKALPEPESEPEPEPFLKRLRAMNARRTKEAWPGEFFLEPATFWANRARNELAELDQLFKNRDVLPGGSIEPSFQAAIADEIADVICYLDLLAHVCDIDLEESIRSKFNRVSERRNVNWSEVLW